jgi:pimeloyl-ACP methyl ester carboxylesterase
MTTFAFIHGAGDSGSYWRLVEAELRARGHRTVAPDLPADDDSATLSDYAEVVIEAVRPLDSAHDDLVVVAQSFGAFTAPLVAARRPVSRLVLVAGMLPLPGEPPDQWWEATGYADAMDGRDVPQDPLDLYFHDVPGRYARTALAQVRRHPSAAACEMPWPLHSWPPVPTRFVVCTRDRLFPPRFLRRVVKERLGARPAGPVELVELSSGHCAALARPRRLARLIAT